MDSTYLSSGNPIPTQSLIFDRPRSCSLFNRQSWQPIKVSFDTKWSYTISASQEPTDIDDLLRITKNALKINVQKRPRMNPIDAWKDPDGCCQRMGILWKEALEMIIVPLRKEDLFKGPEPSRDARTPQKKWIFKVYTPPEIEPRRRLYIKLSSRGPNELLVESFHETSKPSDYVDYEEEDWI